MPNYRNVDGVLIEMTDEEVAADLQYTPPPISPPIQILGPISAATLAINAGEVTGIETSINFGMAFAIDVDKYWVLFTNPEPDTNYLVLGNVPFVRNTDYIEITAPDLFEVSLTTWRVEEA
jgi:hypothetical protein